MVCQLISSPTNDAFLMTALAN